LYEKLVLRETGFFGLKSNAKILAREQDATERNQLALAALAILLVSTHGGE